MLFHHGKLVCEAKTMVTETMEEHIQELARQAKCQPAELIRDAIYAAFSGDTFTGHVANDRRSVMSYQGSVQGDKRDSK
jgi:hypothetical protein